MELSFLIPSLPSVVLQFDAVKISGYCLGEVCLVASPSNYVFLRFLVTLCGKGDLCLVLLLVFVSQRCLVVVSWLLVAQRLFQHMFLLCLFPLIPLYMVFFSLIFGFDV